MTADMPGKKMKKIKPVKRLISQEIYSKWECGKC